MSEFTQKQNMVGISALLAGLLAGLACYFGHTLRKALQTMTIDEQDEVEWLRLRTMIRMAEAASAVFAITSVSFGIYAIRFTYYTQFIPLSQYMLVLVGFVVLQLSLLGFFISFGKSLRNERLLFWYRWLLIGSIAFLVVTASVCLAYVGPAKSYVETNWAEIWFRLDNDGRATSVDSVVNTVRSNLVIEGVLAIMQACMQALHIWLAFKLNAVLRLEPESPRSTMQTLSPFDIYILLYCALAVCGHLFWSGEYAVFNGWIAKDSEDYWFLAGWRVYAQADGRFQEEDSLLIVMAGASAFVSAPACLMLAWATYLRKPVRGIAAILVFAIEAYCTLLKFISGLLDTRVASTDELVYFWLLIVFIDLLRVSLPLPIFLKACSHVWKCVDYYDSKHNEVETILADFRLEDSVEIVEGSVVQCNASQATAATAVRDGDLCMQFDSGVEER